MKSKLIILAAAFIFPSLIYARGKAYTSFIENKGQIIDQNNLPNPTVKYLWNGGGMKLQLRDNAFSYEVLRSEKFPRRKPLPESMMKDKRYQGLRDSLVWHSHRVDVSLINANPHPELVAEEAQTEVLNYYTTGTPEEGVTNVHQYGKVTYKNIYPNIDLEFETSNNTAHPFKYNFIVHPGGDVNAIQLHYEGADGTALKQGSIQITTANGKLEEAIPASFTAENSKSVNVKYQSFANNTYGFKAGKYPASQTLVIDPWATYFGMDSSWVGTVSINEQGNIATSGWTDKLTNVATSGAFQTSNAGNSDLFIRKWSSFGFPVWCTYYGGSDADFGGIVKYDGSGNLYLNGTTTSTNNIATPGSYIDNYQLSIGTNSFLAKFNPNGLREWSTYLPILNPAMDVDNNGNIAIVGDGGAPGLASVGAHQVIPGGNSDAFLLKFNSNGTRLWATYYGGGEDELYANISIDPSNNIYLSGTTRSTNNIATPGSFQSSYNSFGDVYIVKFNSTGIRQWGTYYGGNGDEEASTAISTDPFGNFYVSGPAGSANFFATPGAFQSSINTIQDIFLAKFTASGQRLWSTYFGGSSEELNNGVVSDHQGNALLFGQTLSKNVIATPGSFQDTFGSIGNIAYDAFLEKFNPSGQRIWGTYLGGSDEDIMNGLTVANNNNIVLCANVSRSGIATTGSYNTILIPGAIDGYLASFDSSGTLTTPVPELSGPATSLIKVFPNPTNDIVQVTLPSMSEGTITISDAMGRLVKTVTVKTQELTIDLKGLAAGVYLLEYKSEQMSETVKLIKE